MSNPSEFLKMGESKIILTDSTYYIDNEGYLLDKDQHYLVDSWEQTSKTRGKAYFEYFKWLFYQIYKYEKLKKWLFLIIYLLQPLPNSHIIKKFNKSLKEKPIVLYRFSISEFILLNKGKFEGLKSMLRCLWMYWTRSKESNLGWSKLWSIKKTGIPFGLLTLI